MKSFVFLVFLLLLSNFNTFCQIDTVPNAGFERWKFMGWFYNPDGWQTNNNQLMEYVVKDTDAYIGQFAMRVKANGWAQEQSRVIYNANKFPNALFFYAKCHILNFDTFTVEFYFLSKGKIFAYGQCQFTSNIDQFTGQYTGIDHQYNSTVDTIGITIKGGTIIGNYIILDAFHINEPWLSINTDKFSHKSWNTFSNNHLLEFEPINLVTESVINIISATGQTVYSKINCTQPLSIPLNPGIYFYRITQNNSLIQSGKVVVN